ncbi:MAG TPA: hypothetical protein VF656_04055 [Pyrinomonadaceae bacterium]|jgi:tetratricopeptide (TPR) repeat protein
MEPKDVVTLIISSTALILSLISTVLTLRSKKYEVQRTIRDQVTELIGELIAIETERRKLAFDAGANKDELYFQTMSILNQKTSSLVRQAVYLINQEPLLITDIEYGTVAQSLTSAGDLPLADEYWRRAINASPSDYYKVLNRRGYAHFLFTQGRYEAGRKQFQEAVTVLDDTTDFNKLTNGYTYQGWMVSEAGVRQYDEAKRWYERSKATYESIANPAMKKDPLVSLEQARKRFLPTAPTLQQLDS